MKIVLLLLAIFSVVSFAGECGRRRNSLRKSLLVLHKRAARCGDTDTACVDRVFKRITGVRRQLAQLRKTGCNSKRTTVNNINVSIENKGNCARGTFDEFMERRRDRISRMSRKCNDEDDQCITTAMNLLIALNGDVDRQKRIWRASCPKIEPTPVVKVPMARKPTLPPNLWVHRRSWTHEFTCDRIKKGFRTWLAFQKARRSQVHDESCRCDANDLPCLRMNYQIIIRIQRHIRHNRNLFADRISSCDRCAPIKIRWQRWLIRQRARRHRLQLEACRCDENDTECMQRRVNRIKKIQRTIRTRRAQVLALHGSCTMPSNANKTQSDDLADI